MIKEARIGKTSHEGNAVTDVRHPDHEGPLTRLADGQVWHYVTDHLGTPQEMYDQDGEIVWAADFSAYGLTARSLAQEVDNPIRFPGQYYDQESGLHYNRFRYYDSQVGRYINQDPIGLIGGANLYAYVVGNPLSYSDSSGLLPSWSDIAATASDATGGCSTNTFVDDVVNNFVNVRDSMSLLKAGTSLVLGGRVAKRYGGLTVGSAAMGLVKEVRSGFTVTGIGSRTFVQAAATSGATWAINSVLIKGAFDAGVLAGSILRTAINRAASGAACTCRK